jgi:hypothetical protein
MMVALFWLVVALCLLILIGDALVAMGEALGSVKRAGDIEAHPRHLYPTRTDLGLPADQWEGRP